MNLILLLSEVLIEYINYFIKKVKNISPQIEQYLTPLALAVLILDDGS